MNCLTMPRSWRSALVGLVIAVVALAAAGVAKVPSFRDPLLSVAQPLTGALRPGAEPLIGAANAGSRTVAVGLRGLVAYAGEGEIWKQAAVPVQTDLVGVQMLNDRLAWAVGHDSVILRSHDGARTWDKQFDRTAAKASLPAHYQQRLAAGEEAVQKYIDQIKLNTDGDVSLPFLGVWFDDEKTGFAVGAFGMIVASTDGGQTWTPWLDRIENDGFLNLNSIRGILGQVYIAGEQGMVYRLDRERQRFVRMPTGHKGSLFDIVGNEHCLIAFGLRGAAYRSTDGGANWHAIDTGVERSITAGVVLENGRRIVLFTETGQAIQSLDNGSTFAPAFTQTAPVYGATASGDATYATVGYAGAQVHSLKAK